MLLVLKVQLVRLNTYSAGRNQHVSLHILILHMQICTLHRSETSLDNAWLWQVLVSLEPSMVKHESQTAAVRAEVHRVLDVSSRDEREID